MAKKASKKKKKPSPPKLRVAFDTNALYTNLAHHLLRRGVKDFIHNNADHMDLKLEWYLSDVVTRERAYQMQKKATELYSGIEQLEKLLGHQITTEEIISDRIRSIIDDQLAGLGIQRLQLDKDAVDWHDIVSRAVDRRPPFDPSAKEKGFRDAVVAEAFLQLVFRSPTTAAVCRLAFVSGDELIRDYIRERIGERQNVRILENLNELEGLINTLVADVPEEKIQEWQAKAKQYFFEKAEESTLFYREDIRKKLAEEFANDLNRTPAGTYYRQQGTWYIDEPVFIKKDRQRIHWMTEIEAHSKLLSPTGFETGNLGLFGTGDNNSSLGGLLTSPPQQEVGSAKTIFEVDWSVSVSEQRETLSRPQIEELRCVNTEFEVVEQSSINKLAEVLRQHQTKKSSSS